MFRCSGLFRAVPSCSGIPVFQCPGIPMFLDVPVFRAVPMFPVPVSRCSGVHCSGVHCSGVPAFSTRKNKLLFQSSRIKHESTDFPIVVIYIFSRDILYNYILY